MTAIKAGLKDSDFYRSNEIEITTDSGESGNTFNLQVNRIIPHGDYVKCGEIIIEFRKKFSLVCSLCTKQFGEFDPFRQHLLAVHLDAQSEEECKPFECLFLDEKSCPSISELSDPIAEKQESQSIPGFKHNQSRHELLHGVRTWPEEFVPNVKEEPSEMQKKLKNLEENNPIEHREVYFSEVLLPDMPDLIPHSKLEATQVIKQTSRQYLCNACNISFRHKASYNAHAQKRHNMITKSMKKKIIKETCHVIKAINSIKQKRFEIQRRHFSCPQCNEVCSDNSTLVAHVRSSHGPDALNVLLRKYTCKYCDKKMKDMKEVELHIESRHPGDAKYVCPHCDKTFKRFEGRRVHIYTHTGERPYLCPHCPKRFAVPANLRMHIFMHLKIKNYACRYCDKLFVQSSVRNIHEQRHTGEKPHQCEDCGKQFFTSTLLAYHRRHHQNVRAYKCDLCDKSYFTSTSLNEHKERHSGERKYKCSSCDLAYTTRKSLRNHKKSHSHVNKHLDECELSFDAN